MSATNIVARELESYGVRTFSAKEMAFNILGLMHPLLFSITQVKPIWADLNGGMDRSPDLADITNCIWSNLNGGMDHSPDLADITNCIWLNLIKKGELRRAIARDRMQKRYITNSRTNQMRQLSLRLFPRLYYSCSSSCCPDRSCPCFHIFRCCFQHRGRPAQSNCSLDLTVDYFDTDIGYLSLLLVNLLLISVLLGLFFLYYLKHKTTKNS
jgi:hypothetical protein